MIGFVIGLSRNKPKFQVGFTLVFNSVNILSENIKEIGLNFVQLLKNQTGRNTKKIKEPNLIKKTSKFSQSRSC